MFLVTDINSVAAFATMCAGFSIPHIVAFALSVITRRHAMLLIANISHVANSSTEITNNFHNVDRNVFGFEIEIQRSIT